MKVSVAIFIDLLESFLDERIKAREFVESYLALFASSQPRTGNETKALADSYLNKQISLDEFRAEFKRLAPDLDESLFHILNDLYEDIDAYSPLWTPEDFARAPYLLDEEGLRKEVNDALENLKSYQSTHGA